LIKGTTRQETELTFCVIAQVEQQKLITIYCNVPTLSNILFQETA